MNKKQMLTMAAGTMFAMSLATFGSATAFASTTNYVVKPGDSYYTIGHAHHQPYRVLEAINGYKTLYPGETIHLATPHVVKSGDSVWKIAHEYGVSPSKIEQWNHLSNPSSIWVGETLWIGAAGSGASQAPTSQSPIRSEVVSYSKTFIGTPYRWGGTTRAGMDCSGFVTTVYHHFGIYLPRTANSIHGAGTPISKSQLRPGDLVFFNTLGRAYSHVGIYVGNGQFISATSSHGVAIKSLYNPYWGPRYTGAIRVLR